MEDSMNDMQRPAIDLVYDDLLATIEERDAALARVAELETALDAERAAHRWRPVTEKPPKPDWYQVAETPDDLFGTHAYFNGAVWGSCSPLWYRSILPLPPAPQEPTP